MSTEMEDAKLILKLLIDKKANKVLFAEAGKDFVDFLFYLLSLPIATVIQLLTKTAFAGNIGNLHESLKNLNEAYMQPNQNKDLLLKPYAPNHVTNVSLLLSNNQSSTERKFYRCSSYNHCPTMTDKLNTVCRRCRNRMSEELEFIGESSTCTEESNVSSSSSSEGGIVKGLVTYMVTDDLSVTPMSMISGVGQLTKFNVKDFGALEEKVVGFGFTEALELLKASLQSKAALSTVFLAKKEAKIVVE